AAPPAATPLAAAPATVPPPPARPAVAPAETSLNALTLAKGILTDQLSSLPRLLGLLAAVAYISYRIGRRAGGR
ncbi:carbon monoxide dehydrogenase, partial [Cryobacterium sp. TMT2-10]